MCVSPDNHHHQCRSSANLRVDWHSFILYDGGWRLVGNENRVVETLGSPNSKRHRMKSTGTYTRLILSAAPDTNRPSASYRSTLFAVLPRHREEPTFLQRQKGLSYSTRLECNITEIETIYKHSPPEALKPWGQPINHKDMMGPDIT